MSLLLGEREAAKGAVVRPAVEAGPAARGVAARIVREPVLHFVIAGLVLLGAYSLLSREEPAADDSRRIEITEDDLRQMTVAWLAQGRPMPTPDQIRALVDQKVTAEILYREAIALGLDRDDEIIKRRLAQKMDFLVADVAAMAPPTAAELEAWFDRNAARFSLPPHASFRHLYFALDRPGAPAQQAASDALPRVSGLPPNSPELRALADPFMFRNYYGDATPEQMAKEFGPRFAEALFALTPGSWQGPIESGYGWHLVRVDSFEPGRIPAFEEAATAALEAWQVERYAEVRGRAIDEMRARYDIVTPPLDGIDVGDLAAPGPADGPPAP